MYKFKVFIIHKFRSIRYNSESLFLVVHSTYSSTFVMHSGSRLQFILILCCFSVECLDSTQEPSTFTSVDQNYHNYLLLRIIELFLLCVLILIVFMLMVDSLVVLALWKVCTYLFFFTNLHIHTYKQTHTHTVSTLLI